MKYINVGIIIDNAFGLNVHIIFIFFRGKFIMMSFNAVLYRYLNYQNNSI